MTDCFSLRLKDIQLLVLINLLHIHLCGKYFVTVASSTAINCESTFGLITFLWIILTCHNASENSKTNQTIPEQNRKNEQ